MDPIQVIEFAIETMQLPAQAKKITLRTQIDPQTGLLLGDATRLQQVMWHLLTNVVKFSLGHSTLILTTRRSEQDSRLEIQVSDCGVGIEPEFLPFVFERFRQEDNAHTRKYSGLGLGLALVRHIVELHGGTVSASSPGRNQGSTFLVLIPTILSQNALYSSSVPAAGDPLLLLLPLRSRSPSPSATTTDLPVTITAPSSPPFGKRSCSRGALLPEQPQHLAGVKILFIDDEDDTRLLIKTLLARCGAEVRTASSSLPSRLVARRYFKCYWDTRRRWFRIYSETSRR